LKRDTRSVCILCLPRRWHTCHLGITPL